MSVFLKTNKIQSSGIKSLNFSTSIVKNGLILHVDAADIDSYSGSGTKLYDLSQNGMTGTTGTGVSYSSSNTGVMSFDTTSDANISFLGHQFFQFYTGDFTIEMWSRPGNTGIDQTLWDQRKTASSNVSSWSLIVTTANKFSIGS
jgi:hypothetical protein